MNIFFSGKSKNFNVLPNINDAQKMFELILLKIEMKNFSNLLTVVCFELYNDLNIPI